MKYELYRALTKWLLQEMRRLKREELNHIKTKVDTTIRNEVSHCAHPARLTCSAPRPQPKLNEAISGHLPGSKFGSNVTLELAGKPGVLPVPTLKTGREPTAQAELFPQTFVIESFFARELIAVLTRSVNEEMHFLTGPKIGPIRIVCRWAQPPSLDKQSPVFVRATARSVADVLIPIIEQGAELHICAHSHPGTGAGATRPSGTDIACLGKLQRSGSEAIGCIVTRDGHLRFFSVSTNFHALVFGSGVKEITKNVFQLTHQDCY